MEKKEDKVMTTESAASEPPAEEAFKAPEPKVPETAKDTPKEVVGEENKHKEQVDVHGQDRGYDHGQSHVEHPKGLPPKYFPHSL